MSLLSQPGGIVAVFPGGAVGMYGPRGFTRCPEVAELLEPYEVGDPAGDVVVFRGVPARDAARLLALLPANQGDVAGPDGRTFAELVARAAGDPDARVDGFRISPRRFDERVVLDSVTVATP